MGKVKVKKKFGRKSQTKMKLCLRTCPSGFYVTFIYKHVRLASALAHRKGARAVTRVDYIITMHAQYTP